MKLLVISGKLETCYECVHRHMAAYCSKAQRAINEDTHDASTIPAWCPLPDAPAPVEKRCGTCKWWQREDWPGTRLGKCHVSIVDHVPAWATVVGERFTGESSGMYCPTWAAKENYG